MVVEKRPVSRTNYAIKQVHETSTRCRFCMDLDQWPSIQEVSNIQACLVWLMIQTQASSPHGKLLHVSRVIVEYSKATQSQLQGGGGRGGGRSVQHGSECVEEIQWHAGPVYPIKGKAPATIVRSHNSEQQQQAASDGHRKTCVALHTL